MGEMRPGNACVSNKCEPFSVHESSEYHKRSWLHEASKRDSNRRAASPSSPPLDLDSTAFARLLLPLSACQHPPALCKTINLLHPCSVLSRRCGRTEKSLPEERVARTQHRGRTFAHVLASRGSRNVLASANTTHYFRRPRRRLTSPLFEHDSSWLGIWKKRAAGAVLAWRPGAQE
ncbi:hypothetical protein BKA93DRAFT_103835 [Sparassis latifolia]